MPGANVPTNQYKNINKSNHGRNTTRNTTGRAAKKTTAKAKATTAKATASTGHRGKVVLPKASTSGVKKPSAAEIAKALKKAAILEKSRSGLSRDSGRTSVHKSSTPFSFATRERSGSTANSYTDMEAIKHQNATDFAKLKKASALLSSGTGGGSNSGNDSYTDMEAIKHQNAKDLAKLRKASALLSSRTGGGLNTDTKETTSMNPEGLLISLPESLLPGSVGHSNDSVNSTNVTLPTFSTGILSTGEGDFSTPQDVVNDLKSKSEENVNVNFDPLGIISDETKSIIEADINAKTDSDKRVAPYKYAGSTYTDEERESIIDYASNLSDEEKIAYAEGLIYEDGITSQSYDFIVDSLLDADEETQAEMMLLIMNSPGSDLFEPSDHASEIFGLLSPEVQAEVMKTTREGLHESGLEVQWMLSNAAKMTEEKIENIQEYRNSLSGAEKTWDDIIHFLANAGAGVADRVSGILEFGQMLNDIHYKMNGYDPPDGFITNWIDDLQDGIESKTYNLDLYAAASGKDLSVDIARGGGGLLFDLAFVLLTGGVGAVEKGASVTSAAVKAASSAGTAAKTESAASKIINFLKAPFSNAATAERAAYYAGSRYDEAISNGASMGDAVRSALVYAFPQAYVEALGGADKIASVLLRTGIAPKKILTSMATGALSEGFEEGAQQIWESGTKTLYGADIPLFSNEEGEDAWINPTMIKKSASVGAILGGFFGGATTVANNGIYNLAKSADTSSLNTVEDRIKNDLSTGKITKETASQLLKETGQAKAVYDVVQTDSIVKAQGKIDGYVSDGTITKEQGDSLKEAVDTAAADSDTTAKNGVVLPTSTNELAQSGLRVNSPTTTVNGGVKLPTSTNELAQSRLRVNSPTTTVNGGVKLPTSTNELAQTSKSVYNTNIVPNEDVETQKLLDDFSSSSNGEALKFDIASGVNITPAQAQQAFETYLTKTGRADTGLKVDLTAAQGKDQDFGTSTQTGNRAESKLAASSDEAMASLKEQAKGKRVGDTVSAAFMENGQVKVYTASVNESGIGLVSTRNANTAEKAVMLGNDGQALNRLDVEGNVDLDPDILIDSYKNMRNNSSVIGQAHHLNQDAAFRDVIPKNDGLCVELGGNAFKDIGSPHYSAHENLESFWSDFRSNGDQYGYIPTISNYNSALYDSLRAAGLTDTQAKSAVQSAMEQQSQYGLTGNSFVPRIPGRINFKK